MFETQVAGLPVGFWIVVGIALVAVAGLAASLLLGEKTPPSKPAASQKDQPADTKKNKPRPITVN